MPTPTYTLIASSTVGSGGASSIAFTSIPNTYTDLIVKCSLRTGESSVYTDIDINFNGESARQWRGFYAVTNSTASSTSTGFNIAASANGANSTASTFSNCDIYIANYNSTGIKTLSSEGAVENNSTSSWNMNFAANSITNSAAVTSVTLAPFGGNSFVQNSTAYLYGIKNS
jgi:hypothetical protein